MQVQCPSPGKGWELRPIRGLVFPTPYTPSRSKIELPSWDVVQFSLPRTHLPASSLSGSLPAPVVFLSQLCWVGVG